MPHFRVAIAALVVAASMSACAAPQPTPQPTDPPVAESPSATPTPAPEPPLGPQAFADIEALRLGFIEATGLPCPPLSQYYGDADGVSCTQDGWQLFWKPGVAERNAVLQLNVDAMEPSPFVVGPNWLINGGAELSEYQTVADAMHALVWTRDLPIPAA